VVPGVVDNSSLRALYQRIGIPGAAPNAYETTEAIRIATAVSGEFASRH
jgi:hypothetical protein